VSENNGGKNAKELVENLQKLVSQASINRIKGVLENYVKEWGIKADVTIPTRISYPKPIFFHIQDMEEIPMEIFEWVTSFSKHYDLKYVNLKGNFFAFFLYKDFDKRKKLTVKEPSLYEIYEKEKKSIFERDKLKEESVYDYKIRKGLSPLVSGERDQNE
jgi:hypothetical protein